MYKILFLSTIESQDFTNKVYYGFNTKKNIDLLYYPYFNGEEGISKHFDIFLSNTTEIYDGVAELIRNRDWPNLIKYILKTNGFSNTVGDLFEDVYFPLLEKINNINTNDNILIPVGHIRTKPPGFTHFIAWTIDEDEFDYSHIMEHEKLSLEQSKELIREHNRWMKLNKDKFDLFFDNSTAEEVIQKLKSIG